MLIIREMLVGASRFNEIARGLPGISRTLLSSRLRGLQRASLVDQIDGVYSLTESGKALAPTIFGLGHWAQRWILSDPEPEELDPTLLFWWSHTRLQTHLLPERRTVLEFRFVDHENRYWLVVEPTGISVCEYDPGFGVDALVTTDLLTLHRVWNGRESFRQALRGEKITLEGQQSIVRRLPDVLTLATLGEMAETARLESALP